MNPAVDLSVISPQEERAVRQCPAIRTCPVMNMCNSGGIAEGDIVPAAPSSALKCQGDVLQDILSFLAYPWDNIFNDALLSPPPFLAASATLDTCLFRNRTHPQ